MEDWQLDFEWLRVQHYVKDTMGRDALPDLRAMLFLIGIQESGVIKEQFTKEEKQDLMHVAVCTLLETKGYFELIGRDEEGWPHFKQIKPMAAKGVDEQEDLLKQQIIEYFSSAIDSAAQSN